MQQDQFLDVIDRDEAERRFRAALAFGPLGEEIVPLDEALGRTLARDVVAEVDVPSFDRSNYDGFAVRAGDTFGAQEESPRTLSLLAEQLAIGVVPTVEVAAGEAVVIATGGMLPRGADAVVMIEHTDVGDGGAEEGNTEDGDKLDSSDGSERLLVRRAVTPGFGVAFAGTDIARGETVLRAGDLLTSRETGVLAAVGVDRVTVFRRVRVAIISTGDELIRPGEAMSPGRVFDSNARILADAVRELGGEPEYLGIVADDEQALRERLAEALRAADVVLLSGGTSKGQGDLSYRVVSELADPGIVAHGVALKPGKPICLAASGGKPVVVLPGFPTSAIFTFHEFVAPVIRALAGRPRSAAQTVDARLAVKVNSEIGRTEYMLVGLVEAAVQNRKGAAKENRESAADEARHPQQAASDERSLVAYPMGKGSGSVTTFSRADGFITIGRHEEIVAAGAAVRVRLIGRRLQLADLVVIGSHCVGLDYLLSEMQRRGYHTKFLTVGSTAGLAAAERGECDLAGAHLLDAASGRYNEPFATAGVVLVRGYRRQQGVLFRPGDGRFENRSAREAVAEVRADPACVMVNRNAGSGTRVLIDALLGDARPAGYAVQPRSHNAVAAAIAQGRADWGVAIEFVARQSQLGFLPLQDEEYDFFVPVGRRERPAVAAFVALLDEPAVGERLEELGCRRQTNAE